MVPHVLSTHEMILIAYSTHSCTHVRTNVCCVEKSKNVWLLLWLLFFFKNSVVYSWGVSVWPRSTCGQGFQPGEAEQDAGGAIIPIQLANLRIFLLTYSCAYIALLCQSLPPIVREVSEPSLIPAMGRRMHYLYL